MIGNVLQSPLSEAVSTTCTWLLSQVCEEPNFLFDFILIHLDANNQYA